MWYDTWLDPFAEANAEDSGAGTKEYVHVRVQQRNGRKSLTTVQGLKKEFSYSKILKDLKKEFCCNGTVVEDPELGQVCLLFFIDKVNVLCNDCPSFYFVIEKKNISSGFFFIGSANHYECKFVKSRLDVFCQNLILYFSYFKIIFYWTIGTKANALIFIILFYFLSQHMDFLIFRDLIDVSSCK